VLISKIIKQRPKYYHELNQIYKQVARERNQSGLLFEFERSHSKLGSQRLSIGPNMVLEEGQNPLLNLLVKSMHGLFTVIINLSQRPVSKIFGALKSIFKHCDLKVEVIGLLKENSNVPEIINFM